jgi:GNAT superfamily N-acetyltransferase
MEQEYQRGEYTISTDPARLDVDAILGFLSGSSYWAHGRTLQVTQRSIQHSLCFGVYAGGTQAGFARVVTDYATFAWLCDVFILPEHRGNGLGKWLVETIATYPALRGPKLFVLATRNAHELYRRYGGFTELAAPERWMSQSTARPSSVESRPTS